MSPLASIRATVEPSSLPPLPVDGGPIVSRPGWGLAVTSVTESLSILPVAHLKSFQDNLSRVVLAEPRVDAVLRRTEIHDRPKVDDITRPLSVKRINVSLLEQPYTGLRIC